MLTIGIQVTKMRPSMVPGSRLLKEADIFALSTGLYRVHKDVILAGIMHQVKP